MRNKTILIRNNQLGFIKPSVVVLVALLCSFAFLGYWLKPSFDSVPWVLTGIFIAIGGFAYSDYEKVGKLKATKGLRTQEKFLLAEICKGKLRTLATIVALQIVMLVVVIGVFLVIPTYPHYARYLFSVIGALVALCLYNLLWLLKIKDEIIDFQESLAEREEKARRRKEGRERLLKREA